MKNFLRASKRSIIHVALVLTLVAGLAGKGWGQSTGDYRSAGSGSWNALATWTRYNGSAWATPTSGEGTPISTTNVYIQTSHTVTLTQNEACNNLNVSNGTASGGSGNDGVLQLATFTLEVNGSLRSYYGAVGTIPGTGDNTVSNMIITTSGATGTLKFVGSSRDITTNWGAGNTGALTAFAMDISLTAGQTATMSKSIKAKSWVINTGILDASARVAVDNGTANSGNVTIGAGATISSSATGTGTSAVIGRTGTGAGGTLLVTGTLKLSGASPNIYMSTVTLNGTVEYNNLGSQTLAYNNAVASAASITPYTDLKISGSGIKTLAAATTVSGTTTIDAGCTLASGAFTFTNNGTANVNGSFQINQSGWATGNNFIYGAMANLVFNNTSGSYGVNADAYWPASSGPTFVNVAGAGGITMNVARTVSNLFATSAAVNNANNLTANGTLQINTGGSLSGTPTYGGSSTLVYYTSSYTTTTNEFPATGVKNVIISAPSGTNTVTLDGDKTISGTLAVGAHTLNGGKSINAATITLGTGAMVMGDITTSSAFTCSGASSVSLSGAWSVSGFTKSTSTVNFTGNGDFNNATSFYNLTNSGGIRALKQNIDVENNMLVSGGEVLCGAGPFSLTLSGTNSILNITTGSITGTDAGSGNDLILIVSGTQATLTGNATSNFNHEKKFFNVIVMAGSKLILQRGLLCRYGTFTCSGTLQIDANGYVESGVASYIVPSYNASTGALVYNTGGAYTSSVEWPTTTPPIDVTIQNSGTQVTLNEAKSITGSLSIAAGSINLGTYTSSCGTLTLGGAGAASGPWGGTGSGASHINTTFFAANSGILNVGTSTCTAPAVPFSGGNQSKCSSDPYPSLGVTVGAGETADWYDASSGGALLLAGNTSYTPTGGGTFYAEARNTTTNCVSATRTGVTLTVTPDNTAGAPSSTPTLCINTALSAITHTTTGASGIGTPSNLPSGVSASWASSTITISGTPTASGTFNYSIPLTGGCGSVNATGTITVTAANTAAGASSTPTLCINTALTDITHATTGATGIGSPSNLPAGVTAAWASDLITISGTPTASGTFGYSIPLTGGCGSVNATGTITVTAANTAAGASSTPTLCINTALTDITHATTGATGIGSPSSLPAGVTAAWASDLITISGTPTASGTFSYNIPLTGGCGSVNATGTITVTAANTAAGASSTPTLCINTALTDITHATTGATGIGSPSNLPAGVTAAWASDLITISGTPTESGTFGYSIPLTGGCGSVNATGTITVTAANTAAGASSTPTLCINTALTDITHATTGATGIGSPTNLPAGVTAAWASDLITISGTPTASGTFSYSIPLTGGCGSVNATGTITVTAANTAAGASSTPTLCINTALTDITHATTGATGIGSPSDLPAGVTAAWASDLITISGTPTASGTFSYSIPLTGGCGSVNATGTITVTAANTAAGASSTPTLCKNTALTDITHATTGATGIGSPSSLPAGITAAWASDLITISGTPTASGTFGYSIPLTGGCGSVNATGTITVTAANTAAGASSTPTLCINTALTDITHATTGATGIGSPSNLPAGVTAAWASDLITISGTPTASGTFGYSIPLTGGCGSVNATGTITVMAANTAAGASSTPTLCINTALTDITHATTGATGIGSPSNLPAGVTAACASDLITISGTPTASGTFGYSIPLTGGCGSVNATGTITVTAANTAAGASSTPTLCINTALTDITHATTGATGIGSPSNLPAGVTAAWASDLITISGTPTASGTFGYSIPLTGGCGSVNATGTITVTAANTAAGASSTPTLCINTALTDITHATTGATGIGSPSNLPAGVTAAWASDLITISGTPTASGTFGYSIPLTGGCGSVNATGTITVTAANTAAGASSTPTLCINTTLTDITHATTGATGIGSPSGLPAGVTAAWASDLITISGTPTASGTFGYSIPLTGGCGSVNATGTITVTLINTASGPSATPTLCINTVLSNITHTTTGASGIGSPTNLPAGVTAAWASDLITISGTPTASGTFGYSIPLTGGCGSVNATGTITVTAANTAAGASSTPTLCINTALTDITHVTTGATGIGSPSNLPAGVTAAWASDLITISGTPTASGTFNYSIPLTGGCGSVNATGTITVTAANTAAGASSTPTLCINTALTDITHVTTGATGIGSPTNLPAGVTAAWASDLITISGTPTASGTFGYSIPLTGGCGSVNATGTITVTLINTANSPSATPTLCINTVLSDITHTTTGASGIGSPTNLPAGVTAAWASDLITISGTPTASGTFGYSIPLTGGCGSVNATGTITVTAANTAAGASSTPTLCINTALTDITHATTGATGIGSPTNLPAGVTAAWASDLITISGTPTASGTFGYSIPLTGGCGSVNATGTITVTAANTAAGASSTPTLCINTALTDITHATTGATGIGSPTNLPAGVTAAWASDLITISGTPTASGTFGYSIPLTGGCGSVNATGTITVTLINTANSPSATPTQCINTVLSDITHTTTGASGIGSPTNLPAGVTAAWASDLITISGTPTASGTFGYSIPLTGGCGSVNATGTITVTAANTAAGASSAPTLCINTALTDITHATTGATGIGSPTNLPAGVTAAWASDLITISGTPTASGTFGYSIPLTGGCGSVNATGTITVTAANTAAGASSTPTVCINTALTDITHATTGATGIGSPTNLPAGVTAAWASDLVTISGTPTASGTFGYSIPLTGGCGSVNATGTITVTLVNTASGPSATPTLCINTVLSDITHTTTGATGIGSPTNLPAGVTAAWASDLITISGTPTASGTFNYSIPLTGGCGSVNATGTINVVATPGLWTGRISNSWNNASNWCDGAIPGIAIDVVVNAGGNQPVVDGAAACNSLTVNAGASVTNNTSIYVANDISGGGTFTNAGTLNLYGNATVTTFTATAAGNNVSYDGASQTVRAGYYYNLATSGSGTKTMNGYTDVSGVLGIGVGTTFATANYELALKGDLTNGGTFNGGNSRIWLTGNADANIESFSTTGELILYNTAGTKTLISPSSAGIMVFGENGNSLSVNTTLNVGTVRANNAPGYNCTFTLAGSGTLFCTDFTVGSDGLPNSNVTHTVNSTLAALVISHNLYVKSYTNGGTTGQGTFNQISGTVSVNGTLTTYNGGATNVATYTMGNSSPVLNLCGATPFSLSGTGTSAITLNGTGATVNYCRAGNQNVLLTPYTNLILSGIVFPEPLHGPSSNVKTFTGATTISGNLSIESTYIAALETYTSSCNTLTLGGAGTRNGSWGGPGSAATFINTSYFAIGTGVLNVSTSTCSPPATPGTGSGDLAYCEGSTIPTISVTTGAGETADWYDAVSGGSPLVSGTVSYTPADAGTYYAEARNTTTNCISAARKAVVLTENALPVPAITGPAAICGIPNAGNHYTTEALMTGYTWTVSAGGTITAGDGTNDITVTWSTTGTKTVTVTYTDTYGCNPIAPASLTVNVGIPPVPTIIDQATWIPCKGSDFNGYSTESGMTGYVWDVSAGGTITNGAGTSSIFITWDEAGAQSVSVNYTNGNGCTAAAPTVYNVTVNAPPTITVSDVGPVDYIPGTCTAEVELGEGINITLDEGSTPVTYRYSTEIPYFDPQEIFYPYTFPTGTTTVAVRAENDCWFQMKTFTVTVKGPILDITTNTYYCSIDEVASKCPTGDVIKIADGTILTGPVYSGLSNHYTYAPGNSPGCVTAPDMTLNSLDILAMEVNGTTACTQYDQWIINGTVTLGNATLSASKGLLYSPSVGDVITIIDNDLSDPVIGTFAGLNEGSIFTFGGYNWVISYVGGAGGNNVTLSVVSAPPSITCPPDVVTTTNTGCTATGVSLGSPTTVTPDGFFSLTNNAPSAFPLGSTTVTWTVTDIPGQTATCAQTVTVTDDDSPLLTCPADIVKLSDPSYCGKSVNFTHPVLIDNCSGALALTYQIGSDPPVTVTSVTSDYTFPVGITTVKYTATDVAGNTTTCSFTVTVNDNTPPTITNTNSPANFTAVNTPGLCTAPVIWTPLTASDNCTGVLLANNYNPGYAFPVGVTTVIYTATDAHGNTTTTSFTVTVTDTEKPVIVGCPANINLPMDAGSCGAIVSWVEPTATDNCTLPISPVRTDGTGIVNGTLVPAGVYTITYSATDGAIIPNTSLPCSFTITVQPDVELPVWTTAAGALNTTLECSNAAGIAAAQALVPAASDNCTSPLTPVKTAGAFVAGSCPQSGTYTNTWTVSDAGGNAVAAVYTQVITITDNTIPTWTTAALALDATVQCSDVAALATAQGLTPAASDNCDGTLTPVKTAGAFVAGSCPQAGTYTNTWTVSDDCGNAVAAVYTQIITVIDNTAPTWTTAALALDATVQCSDIAGLATAQGLTPAASDNCDVTLTPVKTAGSFVAGACPQAGTYTNTWTVSDDCGNVVAGVYTQTITVIDNTAPTWTTAALALDATLECSDIAGLATAQGLTPAASDNCDGTLTPVKTAGAFIAGSCPQAGTYTNTWTVSDDCGNVVAGVYTQVITITDNTAPTWTTAALALDATLECSNIAGLATAQGLTPAASDNCDLTLTPVKTAGLFAAGACPQAGTYTNTWTVSDDCGNVVAGVYTQVITITDNTAPTWTTAALALDATLECSDIAGLATAQGLTPAASDNCDLTLTPVKTAGPFVAGACPQAGTYTNTWTVSDDCGNVVAGVYTQVITITDNTAPTWTTAALALDATVQCSDAAALATAQGLTPAASDNCDGSLTPVKTAGSFVAGACPQAGTYTNTWTVSDDCGNVVAGIYTQTITVIDNTAPTWTTAALALDATLECSDIAGLATAQGLTPAASDNCDGTLTPVKTAGAFVAGSCPQAGTYTNTWTVSDDCGNIVAGVYTQVITITDNTAPTWTTAALALDATLECSDIAGLATAQGLTPAASDNCDLTLTPVKTAGPFVAGACPQAGTYTNTWTVSDDCGNVVAGVYTQVITITDNTAPTWTTAALALDATLECSDIAGLATAQGLTPAASDNCDLTLTPVKTAGPFVAGACPQAGTYTNTWTVSDDCGNVVAGVYTQVITITDNTAPTWTTAALALDATLECSDIAGLATAQGLTPAASDNCDGSLTPVKTAGSFVAGACPQAGTYTNTWTVSDDCGNVVAGVYTQVITITDNTAPTWTTAALALDATLECSDIAGLATAQGLTPAASDNCDGTLTPVKTAGAFVAGSCPQAGTYTNTWTVSDDCSNIVAGVYTQVITITDNTAPTWTTAALALDATLECSDIAGLATAQGLTPAASDNCDLTLTPVKTAGPFVAGACPQAGTYTNTWTVSDDCGNVVAGVYTQVITITDNTAPTWTTAALALDATLECSDIAGLATAQGLTPAASDNCDGSLTPVKTAGAFVAGACPQAGTYTNTWTVSDDCGNVVAGVYTQVITITDNTAPTWTTAALALDATLECSDIAGLATAQGLNPVASDNCDLILTPVKTAGSFVAGACPQAGTYTNTWTVSDDCGNVVAGVYTQVITITDNTAPTWTTAALALDATLECSDISGLATAQGLTPVASDNCDLILTPVKTAGSFVAGACPQAGTYTNTWTVSDDCGNVVAGVYTQVITITDNTAPTWTTAALALDATLECSDIAGLATAQGLTPAASDNCDGTLTPVKTAGAFIAGSCPQAGTYTNTWTVSDDCGNVVAGVYTQVITITDNTAPTWTTAALALDATLECSDIAGLATAQGLTPAASDNCDGSLTPVKTAGPFVAGACPQAGTYTNTWTVSDDCGNVVAGVYTQVITITDNTAPTWTTAALALDATLECSDIAGLATAQGLTPVASDNCDLILTPVKTAGSFVAGACPQAGTYTNTWTVSDDCGNVVAGVYTQVITITDNTAPTWTTAALALDATLECSDISGLATAQGLNPVASDNCDGSLTPVKTAGSFVAGACPQAGTYTNTWTVSDDCGNVVAGVYTQVITITDLTAPTWTTAAGALNATVQCSDAAALAAAQALVPVAIDNCDGSLTPVKSSGAFVPGVCPSAGTYTNTWTVSDDCGNSVATVYIQTITVIDITPPTLVCPGNIALNASASCTQLASWTIPVPTDNCSGVVTLSYSVVPFVPISIIGTMATGLFDVGVTTITYTASDCIGNTTTCSFTVTVTDVTSPTITGIPATINKNNTPGLCSSPATWPPVMASDNCPGVTLTSNWNSGDIFPVGTTTVIYTATDAHSNVTTASFNVIVTDNEKPTWTTAANNLDRTLQCSDIAGLATAQGLNPVATDNCTSPLTPVKTAGLFVAGACPQAGTYTNTWTVADAHGNTVAAVYTQTITLIDNTIPVWTTVAGALDATVQCSDVGGFAAAQALVPVASDNCDGSLTPVKTAGAFVAGSCPQAGTYTNTWTVSDDCGNAVAAVYTQIITVIDNTAPTWTTAALALDATVQCSDIAGLATAQGLTPAASDNCDGTLTPVKTAGLFIAGACPQAGTYTNTWTVSDDCGNAVAAVYTQIITVIDNTAPTWTTAALALDATLECSDIAGLATAQGLTPAASDNCDGTLTPVKTAGAFVAGSCPQAGTYTNTWTVSDDCGNVVAGVYTQVITITDNTAPTWTTAALALDATLECSDIAGLATAQGLTPVASDNCDGSLTPVKTAGSFVAGACPQAGTYTNTWTVSDDCGNVVAGVYTQVITITDNTAPTWTTAALALDATLECSDIAGLATAQGLTPAASDNCDGSLTPVKTAGPFVAGACPQAGTYTNTWTVSDDCGNVVAGVYTQVITITDNTAPTWTTAALALDATLECSDIAGLATAQGLTPAASDNCDGSLTPVKTAGPFVAGACPQAGTYTNTWTVSDDCGNVVAGVYTQVITITDNTAPTWTTAALALDATLECSDIAGLATAQGLNPVASDNCDLILTPVKTAGSFVAGACPQAGTYTNTWTVSDDCGNVIAGVYTQVITITDNTAPTWTTAALALDATLECSDIAGLATAQGLTPAASDNCDLILTPVKTAGSFVAGACPQAGTYTNTWTVSDDCGNVVAGVYTQVITITDNTAPTWTTAALALDATLECSDIAGLATAQGLTPAASDNCDGSLTPVKTAGPFVAGACPQAGTYTNTWTVSDDCGNVVAGVYTQVITITDNTAPTWTTAALALDATVQCSDAAALATAQGLTPAASDNCDGTLTPVKTAGAFVAGACPQAGTYTNTWTVSDDCGNVVAAVYTQIITVIDNTAPTWTTAALALDATVQCSDAAALATAQGLNPVASDNCDGTLTPVKTAGPFVAGACPQAGTYTNTWTVSDDCGNVVAGVYTQVITVIDNVNPTASNPLPINGITCKSAIPSPDITVVTDEADNCGGTPVVAFVGDADNGGAGCPADPYIVTRTYSVTDACGNSIAVTQTITVIDDVPPTITCPGPITVHMNSGCFYNGPVGTATATDNCDPSPIITHPFIGTNWPEGVNTVNYYVQDGCGNTASCTQTITVVRNALAGKLVYNNTAQTPMNNVELTLSPGALTATTGADGSYTFSGLCAGTYTVAVTSNHKPVGSINATDAGAANYWGVFGGSIETVKFLAGDVSNDEWIDGDDATRIQRYFVFGESFLRAPWSYWKQGDMVLANSFPSPVPASFSVTVSGADVSGYNLLAQCTGDFNSSFVPSGAKAANSSVRLSTEGTMVMGPNQKFDLPVRAASPMQVGAISLILDIPANFVEVTDVVLSGSSEPVSYKVTGNQVRIGWNSTTPVQFVSNSNLITLKLKTTAAFTNGNTIEIGLVSDPLNELADAGYDVIHQASLLVNNVTSGLVGVGNQQSSDLISLSNYPNPFIKSTTIAYEIPYDGKVTVEVNTMLGQRIGTLVNSTQTQGKYTVVYDAAVLQPGFYLVALKLETAKGTITRSIRLVVMR